jgi:hypothetical protein
MTVGCEREGGKRRPLRKIRTLSASARLHVKITIPYGTITITREISKDSSSLLPSSHWHSIAAEASTTCLKIQLDFPDLIRFFKGRFQVPFEE